MHGGVALNALREENVAALEKGFANLQRHLANMRRFGVPVVVSVNRFSADTAREHTRLQELCAAEGVKSVIADHWAQGGAGAVELAREIVDLAESGSAKLEFLYPEDMPLLEKVRTIAQRIYGAEDIEATKSVQDQFAQLQDQGFGHFPVCIAKTQLSFTTDPNAKGAPTGHTVPIREVRLSAGAEFVVAICGEIMTMPGLPRVPAANNIEVDAEGRITGLF
jgi:formate--tetrahydrofolate ligase